MRLHELPGDPGRQQKIKRVGRGEGSGHGKTSGKGHKGRQARSGGPKRGAFEGGQMPLIRRIPKFGFTNPFRVEYEVVNLSMLDKTFADGDTVGLDELKKARLVRTNKPVKVLGNGSLTRKLKVTVHAYSESARDKIVSAGGSADTL